MHVPSAPADRSAATAVLSTVCVALGAASIVGSIATWAATSGEREEARAHAERFGIFVGLWAPTFFILADMLGRRTSAAPASA
jgi:hypothetical protein